jgi:regulatory protein
MTIRASKKSKEASISHYRLKPDVPPIITAITYQKRDKLRASLFIGGEFAFGINNATVEHFRLRKNDELTAPLFDELRAFDEKISAKRLATKFLNTRRRTEREVREKILKEKYNEILTAEIIADLITTGLIDDEEYAIAFIHDRRLSKPVSSRQLRSELRKKGVAKEIIEKVLTGSDSEETEDDRAKQAAQKKWEQLLRREGDEKKRKQKLIAFLSSRGFEYQVIKSVVNKVAGDVPEEEYEV